MAIKKVIGRNNRKHLTCLKCNFKIEKREIRDNINYICPKCGQVHLVDVYTSSIILTAAEYQELRRRHITDWQAVKAALRRKVIEEQLDKQKKGDTEE